MLLAGSDDGVYRLPGVETQTVDRVLDAGRTMRVRRFPALDGAFAATTSGLYHTVDGVTWTDLGVPTGRVYAVAAGPDGDRLYAGTRPARVYRAEVGSDPGAVGPDDWTHLDGVQRLPSRDEWRLPRHENLAQVRSLHVHADAPDRVVAAVEVGGVHVSEDGGGTWTERREGVHDDVHELHGVDADSYLAATGDGLYRTDDAGRSWRRLDGAVSPSYVRSTLHHDGTTYAGVAPGPSPTWAGGTDARLLAVTDGEARVAETPRPREVVVGFTVASGTVCAATHEGTLLVRSDDDWRATASVPVPGEVRGRYVPLAWLPE